MFWLKLALVTSFIAVAVSLPMLEQGQPREPSPQCDPGEENDCLKCYDVLSNEVIVSDKNRYNLQRAFLPPGTSNPVFVTVTYVYTRNMSGDGLTNYSASGPNETWYWTQSTFYLFQPIKTLQYTSLLFADSSLRTDSVTLYLQPSCHGNNTGMLKLLTQRLKVYAMHQSIAAPVSDSYNAKGENLETLKAFHEGKTIQEGEHLTKYTLSFQIVFPIVVITFLGWLFYHLMENNDLFKIRKVQPIHNALVRVHDIGDVKVSTENMSIYVMIVCSFTFVIYVLVLDCIAVNYRLSQIEEGIFYKPGAMFDKTVEYLLQMEYAIPGLMLAEDLLVFSLMFVGSCAKRSGLKVRWYNILLGPLSCIVVHSYHILVGFIHTQHHATSILIFYGVVIMVFIVTLRTAYYNLFQLLKCCGIKGNDPPNSNCCKNFLGWKCCCPEIKFPHAIVLILLSIISLFIAGFMVFVAILFILVPINMAIDDAPESLFSINQTALLLFGAAVTYKLYRDRKADTFFHHLRKAQEDFQKNGAPQNGVEVFDDWHDISTKEQRRKMASLLLQALYTMRGGQGVDQGGGLGGGQQEN